MTSLQPEQRSGVGPFYCAVASEHVPRCTTYCTRLIHGGKHCGTEAANRRENPVGPNDDPGKAEADLKDAAELVVGIISRRVGNAPSEFDGTSDDDLLGAVEELEFAIKGWRPARRAETCS